MIVATIASLSTRAHLLERVVQSLEPQVDAICVYLNGHVDIPSFLRRPKILHAVLSREIGHRGAEAKLWWWDRNEFKAVPYWSDDDVAIVCDDDIIYPTNYVSRMTDFLSEHPRSIACVHGSVMMDPFETYFDSRWIARARGSLATPCRVHIPGSGTMAFRRGDFSPRLKDMSWSSCVDVATAIQAKHDGLEVWCIDRHDSWLDPMALPKGTSIFKQRTGARNESIETQLLKDAGPWPAIGAETLGMISRTQPFSARPNLKAMMPSNIAPWLGDRLKGQIGHFVELGSGHGTVRLRQHLPKTLKLHSVEHDSKFVGLVEGTNYIHAPIVNGWYNRASLVRDLPPVAEIRALLVDGPPGVIGRSGLLDHLDLFPPKVPMVLDDVHRPAEMKLALEIGARRDQRVNIHAAGDRAFATIGWSP